VKSCNAYAKDEHVLISKQKDENAIRHLRHAAGWPLAAVHAARQTFGKIG
jgi:hypothetical protein